MDDGNGVHWINSLQCNHDFRWLSSGLKYENQNFITDVKDLKISSEIIKE